MKTSVPLNPLTDLLGNKTGGEEKILVLFKWLLIVLSTEEHVDLLRRC